MQKCKWCGRTGGSVCEPDEDYGRKQQERAAQARKEREKREMRNLKRRAKRQVARDLKKRAEQAEFEEQLKGVMRRANNLKRLQPPVKKDPAPPVLDHLDVEAILAAEQEKQEEQPTQTWREYIDEQVESVPDSRQRKMRAAGPDEEER